MRNTLFRLIGCILLTVAAGKLISAFEPVKVLIARDPLVTFLTVRQMLAVAALWEIACAILLFQKRFADLHPDISLCMAVTFIIYHADLWAIGFHGYCGCMGTASGWLPHSDLWVEPTLKGIISLMFVCGVWYKFSSLRRVLSWQEGKSSSGQDSQAAHSEP